MVHPREVAVSRVNGITLTAEGDGNARTSLLTLVTSVQLNGHAVVCSENANRAGGVRNSSVSVWGESMKFYN